MEWAFTHRASCPKAVLLAFGLLANVGLTGVAQAWIQFWVWSRESLVQWGRLSFWFLSTCSFPHFWFGGYCGAYWEDEVWHSVPLLLWGWPAQSSAPHIASSPQTVFLAFGLLANVGLVGGTQASIQFWVWSRQSLVQWGRLSFWFLSTCSFPHFWFAGYCGAYWEDKVSHSIPVLL